MRSNSQTRSVEVHSDIVYILVYSFASGSVATHSHSCATHDSTRRALVTFAMRLPYIPARAGSASQPTGAAPDGRLPLRTTNAAATEPCAPPRHTAGAPSTGRHAESGMMAEGGGGAKSQRDRSTQDNAHRRAAAQRRVLLRIGVDSVRSQPWCCETKHVDAFYSGCLKRARRHG